MPLCRGCLRKGREDPPEFSAAQLSEYCRHGLKYAASLLDPAIKSWEASEVRLALFQALSPLLIRMGWRCVPPN